VPINTREIKAVEVLIGFREAIGVASNNLYVFGALTRASKKSLCENDCMCKVLRKLQLQAPERIHSTELRKFCSTVTHIADLSENDLRWLTDHLGHNLDTHREYYWLRDSIIELSKVFRILLAIDEGNARSFMGKKLLEISVEGNYDNWN